MATAAATSTTTSLRDRLRDGTRAEHDRVESGLRLTDPDLDLARYRTVLERFHGYWAAWEPRVAAELADDAFLAPRRRLHLLRDDLHALGTAPDALAVAPPPPIRGRAEAMGSLYVLEGSTLGGRVIVKGLGRIGVPESARSYFAGHGEATGPMWRAFLQRLEAEPDVEGVVRGARTTFGTLGDWMLRSD